MFTVDLPGVTWGYYDQQYELNYKLRGVEIPENWFYSTEDTSSPEMRILRRFAGYGVESPRDIVAQRDAVKAMRRRAGVVR